MRSDFEEQRARSRAFEIAWTKFLQERGYYTLATYDFSGNADEKAPRLLSIQRGLVVPDVLAFHGQRPGAWFEVKLKSHADVYRKTNTLETGFATRHLNAYRAVKELTGLNVWLVFIHQRENVVRTCELESLPVSHVYTGNLMDRGGTTFLKFDALRQIVTTSELQKFIPPNVRAA